MSDNRIAMTTRHAKIKRMKVRYYSEHQTVDWNTCNAHKSFHYIVKQLWIIYSVNMV